MNRCCTTIEGSNHHRCVSCLQKTTSSIKSLLTSTRWSVQITSNLPCFANPPVQYGLLTLASPEHVRNDMRASAQNIHPISDKRNNQSSKAHIPGWSISDTYSVLKVHLGIVLQQHGYHISEASFGRQDQRRTLVLLKHRVPIINYLRSYRRLKIYS